jgi:hypothetical protein
MPANHKRKILLLVPLLILISVHIALGQQTTAFTYQGRLIDGGTPANGNYDFQFGLWDSLSGVTQIGSTQTVATVSVSNGSFSVQLDFSAGAFPGANRFLEISARPSGPGSYTPLSPRQQITSTPYAIRSLNATNVLTPQISVDGATGNINIGASKFAVDGATGNINVGLSNFTVDGATGNVKTNGSLTAGSVITPTLLASGGTLSINSNVNIPTSNLNVGAGNFTVAAATGNVTTNGSLGVGGTVQLTPGTAGGSTLCLNNSSIISTCSSSVRYKQNILSLGAGLDVVRRLRPITFRWKEGGQPDLGLIAEEVNSIEPLLVTRNAKGQIEGVKYDRLSAVFINAFKEQQAQIQKQQEEIKLQQTEIQSLKLLVCRSHRRARICK